MQSDTAQNSGWLSQASVWSFFTSLIHSLDPFVSFLSAIRISPHQNTDNERCTLAITEEPGQEKISLSDLGPVLEDASLAGNLPISLELNEMPTIQASTSIGSKTASLSTETEISEEEHWISYQDLEINKDLFKRGLLAVRPYMRTPPPDSITDGTDFTISSRLLSFGTSTGNVEAKKAIKLLATLEDFFNQHPDLEKDQSVIYNKKRREELFLSMTISDKKADIGFYVYPWLSSNTKNFQFSGFNQFVMAGCIFGSSLRGKDQYGGVFPLVKHDIKFHPLQKIVDIECDLKTVSLYEATLFVEFEKLMLILKKLSKSEPRLSPKLQYHLPYYDYMLFGIELFIRGRITQSALNSFFKEILIRKTEHIEKIRGICAQHNVIVNIASPFENLFEFSPDLEEPVSSVLETLGVAKSEFEIREDPLNQQERALVQNCIERLRTNMRCQTHRQVWEDFCTIEQSEINNLEQLFKMANAVMIAIASREGGDYETCSLLPLSEKQIQLSYAASSKKLAGKYPPVVNITTLDPVISYDNDNAGLLFYFRNNQTLANLISNKTILDEAHANISRLAAEKKPLELSRVLRPV